MWRGNPTSVVLTRSDRQARCRVRSENPAARAAFLTSADGDFGLTVR